MFPEFEILGVWPAGVVYGREPGNFGDAAFDGVHQAEIGDDPGEGRAFRVAAAVDVERGGREVQAEGDAASGIDFVEAGNPDGGFFEGFFLGGGEGGVLGLWGGAVGVVAFVVQDHERLGVPEVAKAVLGERFRGLGAEVADSDAADFEGLRLGVEPMPVGDQDLALGEFGPERRGDQVELFVIAVRVAWA